MFRSFAEAKGEGLESVKMVKALRNVLPTIISRYFFVVP